MSAVNLEIKDGAAVRTHAEGVADERMFRRPSEWRIF